MRLSLERKRSLAVKAEAYAGNVEEVLPYLATRGISEETADVFGLGFVTEGQYEGRLSIPYVVRDGVLQIKYRCLNPRHETNGKHDCSAKYLYEAGCDTHLFNARALIGVGDTVLLTEGEMDAIIVSQVTGLPVVGYPGTSGWKPFYRLCFEGVQEIVVLADGDDPGRKSAEQVARKLGMNARVVDLGDGEDSNSFILKFGEAKFLERISA